MAYIGQSPFQEFTNPPTKDSFTGDGSTTTFDLNAEVPGGSQNALEVYVDNVRQEPGSGKAFTLGIDGSGDTKRITFSAAPANGASIYVINDKTNASLVAPLQNDLNGTELILDGDADTSITADTDDRIDFKIANTDHIQLGTSSGDTTIKIATDAKDLQFLQADGNKLLEINDGNFVGVGGNSTAAGAIRIFEDTDNGSNYVGLSVGNVSTAYTLVLPNADGSSGQTLTTDGSGNLSFTTMSANTPSSADGQALGSASLEWSDLFLADGGTIQFGNDQDTILTHTDGSGLTLNSTNKLMFNDASQFIHAPSATVLDIGATDEIELTATLIDVVGNFTNSGTITSAGIVTAAGFTIGSAVIGEAELEILDGATVTTGELNLIDGGTSRGTTAIADGDGVLINDDGTMRMTTVQTLSAYLDDEITSMPNLTTAAALVTVSALDTGSITSGFGAIDNGTSGIRTNSFTAETSFLPDAQDGAALGTTSLQFSDLFLADGAVIGMGDDNEVTLTHVADTGVLLNGANVIQLRDAAINIGSPADGDLDINADDEIELNSTLIDINGNVEISGTAVTTGVHTFTAVPVFPNNTIETADIQADAIDGTKIADDAINSEHYTDGSIDTAHIGADQITNAKIADDQIDSEHYVDGSIDNAHLAADAVTGAKIADDAINSEHYTDGSIDTAHIADGQITTAKLASAVFTGATDIGADIADADLFLMDDGAGGTIRKTAASRLKTYVGGPDPSSADGDSLGTSSLEWSDLYLADGGVVYFGNDQDVTITHDPDDGLFFKSKPTTNTNPFILTLQTGETDIANNDVIGEIRFHVPDEANGGDATAFGSCASIKCVGAGAFSSTSNASKIQFHCGGSEDPLLKAVIHSNGDFQVGGGADNNNETTRGAYAKTNGELNAHVDTTNDSPVTIEAFSAGGNGTTQSKFMTSADGSVNSRNNNYASYSDNRLKEQIADAASQWDDIKAVRLRNFKLIGDFDDSKNPKYLGVIAQELESISPKLVHEFDPRISDIKTNAAFGTLYEDGDEIPEGKKIGDVKEVKEKVKSVKYSVLYMKALGALQEAITKIETLESKVKALEDA